MALNSDVLVGLEDSYNGQRLNRNSMQNHSSLNKSLGRSKSVNIRARDIVTETQLSANKAQAMFKSVKKGKNDRFSFNQKLNFQSNSSSMIRAVKGSRTAAGKPTLYKSESFKYNRY